MNSRRLVDLLFESPQKFDFFQAVRLLERIGNVSGALGRDAPRREVVRFAVRQSMAFPASAIHDLRREPGAKSSDSSNPTPFSVMTVAFFGLTGPKGVLPLLYTAELRRRLRAGDQLTADFFDLFNHRLISLFYRAGEKYRIASDQGGGPDRQAFANALMAMIGLGPEGGPQRDRLSLDDRRLLLRAGLFTRQVRTAEGLAALIAETIGIEAEVRQFVPRWVEIGPEFRAQIGAVGRNNVLGQTCMIGRRYLDCQGKFRLRIGPMTYCKFERLLPGTATLRELVELTRLYVGPEFVFDLELILKAEEVPRSRLGDGAAPPALGRQTWAAAGQRQEDASVLVACGEWPGGADHSTS